MDKGKYVRATEQTEEDDNGMNSTTETQVERMNPGLETADHDETIDTTEKGNGSASSEPKDTGSESSDSESSDTESSDSDDNDTGSDSSNSNASGRDDSLGETDASNGPNLQSTPQRTFEAPPWLNATKVNANGVCVDAQQQPTPKTSAGPD